MTKKKNKRLKKWNRAYKALKDCERIIDDDNSTTKEMIKALHRAIKLTYQAFRAWK